MYLHSDLIRYLQQLHRFVETQNRRIEKMELIIQKLQNDLQALKDRPTTNIEKIEYHFDQLKVETLDGTLNIGLNPTSSEKIEDFSVSQEKMNVPDVRLTNKDIIEEIQSEIENYLKNETYAIIEKEEQHIGSPLNESYREFIIDDIRNQLNDRIHYYVSQYSFELENDIRKNDVKLTIIQKVKTDIQTAIHVFMKNIPS